MKNAIILHIINNMKMIKSLIQLFLRGDFSFEPKKLIITLTGKSILGDRLTSKGKLNL